MQELIEFFVFLKDYFILKIVNFGRGFESFKNIIVALLIVKRGKYSSSFLNTSFFLLVASAFIIGPIIVENNPFFSDLSRSTSNFNAAILAYNPSENSPSTIISAKPRDKVIDYKIVDGDTLASIAKKFDVSIDSIKWANSATIGKSDTIMPDQILKIPPITGVVHKVIAGESIYSIAKKYKTSAQNIVNFPFNDFTDLDTFALQSGQLLYVPDGIIEEEKPKYTQWQTYAQAQAGVKGSSNFVWPTTGEITQNPAWYHLALDIANSGAPTIIASDTGTVVYAGCLQWGYGCHVIIDHANGFQTLYAHMSQITVGAGQAVSKGQSVGVMGSTGRSTGTHLHFEIRAGGILQNPWNYLK